MSESDQGYPAEALAEPQGEPEAAPVSAEPEVAEATQAAQEPEETVAESAPYLAPKPENEFVARERVLRAQGWLPPSERPAGYDGPILAGELVEPLFAAVPEPTAAEAASGLATGAFRDHLLSLPDTREWPAEDEHPVEHPSRLPPAARPCKAGG